MPPPTKHPSTRARRNKASTARTLKVVDAGDVEVPELPPLMVEVGDKVGFAEWHPMAVAWWADVWASPMAPEYDDSDRHGLYLLARLVDAAWRASSPTALKDVLGELRLQRACFGLTPIDRRRLQWEIERGEGAEQETAKRRAAAKPKAAPKAGQADPREMLTG